MIVDDEKDLKVAWFILESLTTAIGKSKVDGFADRTFARICRGNTIVIDDIGMPPAGDEAAEAFYRITPRGLRAPLHRRDQ